MKRIERAVIALWGFIFAVSLIVMTSVASAPVLAVAPDDYPWLDATALNARTFDWGYSTCPEAMQLSGTCNAHNYTKDGIVYHESDPWRYDVRNCTSYVAWRVHAEFNISLVGWGDAHNWDDAARKAGFGVDTLPRVGDIAVWEGYYGHVAFVVGVNPDNSVNVEQYNRAGTGMFSKESRVRASHYIHVRPNTPVQPEIQPVVASVTMPTANVTSVKPVAPPIPEVQRAQQNIKNTDNVEYQVALSPKDHQVLVYAAQFRQTVTGFVEVSTSNGLDGNSSWSTTYKTPLVVHGASEVHYRFADYNGDGVIDLYAVKYAQSSSERVEVVVLDGAQQYSSSFGSWRTDQPTQTASVLDYQVADFDGDSKLDIYMIHESEAEKTRNITILNGAKNYASTLGSWQNKGVAEAGNPTFAVADYDRDGQAEIFRLSGLEESGRRIEVLDGLQHFAQAKYVWGGAAK